MVKTKAQERNARRREVYKDVFRYSKTLTSQLNTLQIEEKRRLAIDKLNRIMTDASVVEGKSDLTRSQRDFLAVKYDEAATALEKAAYFAVALSEPLSASIYFQQAFECYYIGSSRYPNKFICNTSAMDSLRESSVACAYEARRRDAVERCKENFWKHFKV